MQIETYEIEPESTEIASLAADGEARMLCEHLGLTGQLSLSANESHTTFPYRVMTLTEQRVFDIHCPNQTRLADYKSDAIPVRVLQVAAHATNTGFLHHIKVWHSNDAKLDPVLVGYKTEYSGPLYLLARWGQVQKNFETLLEEAKTLWMKKRVANLKKALKELETCLVCYDADAELHFQGDGYVATSVYF